MSDNPVILNADDYTPSRYARTQLLERAGFTVTEASTGHEALARVATVLPALVLLDVNFPDISGLEVCHRLKCDPRTAAIPVVHVSATHVSGTARARGLETGADAYLAEPVEPEVLLATVKALLRVRRAEEERERLLAEALAAQAEAQAANRAKDEFLAVLSHELRSPLNSMLGWTRMLRTGKFEPAESDRALGSIERNIESVVRLIEDLLDVSRVTSGTLRLALELVDLGPMIAAAIETLQPTIRDKSLALTVTVDDAVKPVNGDVVRLQQVVGNLLSNAVKFTPKGGRIDVRVDHTGDAARIEVADSGRGIPASLLPHVFDRFRQADGERGRRQAGLGLGLAIVRHIVELHGGSVSAASAGDGHGATFTVHLPYAR